MRKKLHLTKIGYLIVFTIIGTVFLSGCVSMSTMQTGRTTVKDEIGYTVGGGYINSELPLGETDTLEFKAPFAEFGARYGITEKLDVGAKITLIGTSGLDAKYQFLGDKESPFAGSVGLGGGYLKITSGDSESSIIDIMAPIYFSYHPIPWLSLYTSPKYVLRINSYDTGIETGSSTSNWYGATGGLRVGKRVGFVLEYSYFKTSDYDTPLSQVSGGVVIGIN